MESLLPFLHLKRRWQRDSLSSRQIEQQLVTIQPLFLKLSTIILLKKKLTVRILPQEASCTKATIQKENLLFHWRRFIKDKISILQGMSILFEHEGTALDFKGKQETNLLIVQITRKFNYAKNHSPQSHSSPNPCIFTCCNATNSREVGFQKVDHHTPCHPKTSPEAFCRLGMNKSQKFNSILF